MKRNRLYTVNKWNKPAFMPEKNLFAFGDFLKEDSKNYMGNWLGAKDIKAPVGGLIGAAGTAVGSLANNLISNGFTSGAGNGIANIGGAVGSAVSNVNPVLGGIISAGTGAIGGGVNALWGMKADKEALERANASISALNNFSSNAESFDDIRGPQAVAGIGDIYKGGVFRKDDARKKNEELRKNLADAMAFAENSVENNIYNVSQNQLNDALSNYAAYGGPLGFGEGALGLMQQNRYFDTIDKRTEAISKSSNYSMPTAFTGARTFDDGGLMPFLEGFGSDPIGAAVRYNRDVEQRRAAQEAAKEQAAREAEYTAMQQRLANLETRNNGLEAMLTAGAFTPTPSTLPIEASITPSEAAPTVTSTPRRAGKGTRLSGNQWAQEHLNRWHDFLLKKGVSDADATRLSNFFTAQDGLESAGGTSAAAREKNNFGGMQKNGKNITYASPEDYMEDKWKMMNNRFKSALSAQDIDEYATILGNPNYGGKGYLYYVNDKVKLDPNNPEWIKAQTQHMNNYINGMRAWSKKAFGGELGTNGTDFTNGLLEINAGGSHQSNPLEGVPLGVDAEGIPNLVEEGETVYNDYVFSDRMKVPKFMYKELGLGGVALKKQHNKQSISFADASKKLAQESEQRPNDPISKAGLDAALSRLAEVQETERMRKQAEEYMGLQQYACGGKMKKYAHGGKKWNLYDGEGDISQWLQGDLPSLEDLTRGNVVTDIDGNIISVPASAYERMPVGPHLFDYIIDPFKPLNDWQRNYEIEAMMKREGLSREEAEYMYSISRPQTGVAPIGGRAGGYRVPPVNQKTGTFNMSRQATMPRSTTPMPRGNTNAAPATTATRNYVNEAQAAADAQALRTGQQWAANGNRQSTATTERIVEGRNVGGGRFTERASTTRRLNPRPTGEAVTGRGSTAEYDAVYDNLAGTIGARNPKTKGLFPVLVAGVGGASAWGLVAANEQRKKENLENSYNEHPNLRPTIPSVMETINGTTTTTQQEGSATTNTEQQPTATTPTTSNRNSFALFGNLAKAAADAARQGGTPTPTSTYGQPRRGNTSWTTPMSLERVEGLPITGAEDSGLSYQIDDMDRRIRETDDRIAAQARALRTGNGEEERIPTYDTWMRYIPAVGSGIMALTDALGITNKPDYTYANKLEAAANAASYAPNIQYEPIGNYLRYEPDDPWFYTSPIMAQSNATDRNIVNTSGGNAGTARAGQLANAYSTMIALGNAQRQQLDHNFDKRYKVEDFNRKTNMFNKQMGLEAEMANARYRQQASQMGLSGLAQAAALRDSIDQRVGASRSANITNFLNNIGNIGRENMAFNMVNATNVANNGYWIDRKGRIHYARRPKDQTT